MDKKKREREIKRLLSREYRLYEEEEKFSSLPRSIYEKACAISEKVLQIDSDKKTMQHLQETIDFAHLKATPRGISSFTIMFALLVCIPSLMLMTLKMFGLPGLDPGYGVMALALSLFFTYYIYTYPDRLKRRYEAEASSELITFVLYVAMYMRNTPNLEGAVRFAADNLGGTLGYEVKKLLWDVEVGNFLSMKEALSEYTTRWSKNRPFVEATELIITSLRQVGDKRITLLDEAVEIMLQGSREQARHFNQDLKTPVMVIHALGIILPVMGLVLFPIIAVFLHVSWTILFVGYDVLLPLVLYFVISSILESRPPTFSKIDITESPEVPPEGKFRYGKQNIPAMPVGLLIGAVIIGIGVAMYVYEMNTSQNPEGFYAAIVISTGIALGFGSYFMLLSSQRMKVREKTRKIETEFAEALFQLGNQISSGSPIEISMEHSMDRIKNLSIREMFERALKNMRLLGFTFSQAFFDKEYGAIRYYPSKLIKSIMRTVVESTKKGVRTAAVAMLSVSKYLKGLHDTQEEVNEQLNDTLNSLKFQSYFLSPLISGIVVTLAIIIMRILASIGARVSDLNSASVPFLADFSTVAITPFEFIMIVSIYLIETSFILSMFISQIENGEDPIGRNDITGKSLVIGYIVFVVCLLLTLAIFEPLISGLM